MVLPCVLQSKLYHFRITAETKSSESMATGLILASRSVIMCCGWLLGGIGSSKLRFSESIYQFPQLCPSYSVAYCKR
jgi:hypothetical protein